ncbi:MAG: hypothetical protein KatS3mg032_0032 [Cyclobacteriaceae bacterium]|nr:MAG: hypothetical protein KatS3mg032_0032 [Cyclobacteriaceae bacterium]
MAEVDLDALNKALTEIVKARTDLNKLDYDNPAYDEQEERLHDLEDDFQEKYGKQMEKILQQVHNKYCPESDVLMPIAYLGEGVSVELKSQPAKDVRMRLDVSPLRIFISASGREQLVWQAGS